MLKKQIKIDGVYDLETVGLLMAEGIEHFSFDLRPRSFNFIQHYKLLEIIKKYSNESVSWYLHFRDESEFIIKKFINDIEECLKHKLNVRVFLEFSDGRPLEFYNQFSKPYILHLDLNNIRNYSSRDDLRLIRGLVIENDKLATLEEQGVLEEKVIHLLKAPLMQTEAVNIYLKHEWREMTLEQYHFSVQYHCFPVSSDFEFSYRNLNKESFLSAIKNIP